MVGCDHVEACRQPLEVRVPGAGAAGGVEEEDGTSRALPEHAARAETAVSVLRSRACHHLGHHFPLRWVGVLPADTPHSKHSDQLWWRAALRPCHAPPSRGRTSTAPDWLWRMNVTDEIPESSRPLATCPSGSLTSVPAVTYSPASTTQSSPRLMPMPELAPSRQRSPMLIRSFPPPDSVPMIDAPPPTSEPSPTTTP